MKNSSLPHVQEALWIAFRFCGEVERMVDSGCGDGKITLSAPNLASWVNRLEHYGFHIVKAFGAPGVNPENHIFRLLDRLFSLRASLARRLMVLAVKS